MSGLSTKKKPYFGRILIKTVMVALKSVVSVMVQTPTITA